MRAATLADGYEECEEGRSGGQLSCCDCVVGGKVQQGNVNCESRIIATSLMAFGALRFVLTFCWQGSCGWRPLLGQGLEIAR